MQKNNVENMVSNARSAAENKKINRLEQLLSILPLGFGNNKPVVAVLRLEGIIGKAGFMKTGLTLCALNKLIEKMFQLDKLDSVCLSINSPGGSPVQSELICNRITSLSRKTGVPVYSFVEDVAASGGYWLACAGNKIFARPSSIIGSIGVISSGFGFQDAISKLGIERRVFTQGQNKSVMDPFLPIKESDVKIIKELQKNIHAHFIDSVKESRKGQLTQSDDIIFNGEFWTGQTALDYGLIDGIDDLYSYIEKHYGDDIKIEYMENKQSWLKKKLGMHGSSEFAIKESVDAVIDGIEARLIENKFNLY